MPRAGVHARVAAGRAALVWIVAVVGLLVTDVAPVRARTHVVQFQTRAADGTALRGDVLLPSSAKPLATVLQLSPYWNTIKGPGESQAANEAVKPFLDAGFAVALVNLRGTGESDGCFQWGSRVDWSDATRVVQALADQPWSNGNVGMYGTSYEGWTQYMAMAAPPAALKAVVPISGVIDVWSLVTRSGAPIAVGPVASTQFGLLTSFVDPEPALVTHVNCGEYAEHLREGLGLIATGDRTPYYKARDLRSRIADSRVAVLMANGLRYFEEGHTLQFEDLWPRLRNDRTRFMLGQWAHGGKRADFDGLAVGWFDQYLRAGPQTTRPGIVEYQDDAGGWHTAPRWPPPGARTILHLSDGALTMQRDAVRPSARTFQSLDVDTAVDGVDALLEQTIDAAGLPGLTGAGPLCGSHQLLYRSPPLAEEIRMAGNFSVDLTLSSTLSGGNLVATLYRVKGNGNCVELLAGAADVGRAQLDLRHWHKQGASRPFPTGRSTRVRARSLPLAAVVKPGERLVLAIGAGSLEILPDTLKPQVTVTTGDATPSFLSLPVVHGTVRPRSTGAAPRTPRQALDALLRGARPRRAGS